MCVLCSPSKGERWTSTGESDSLIGQPTVVNSPRSGWPTRTTISLAASEASSMLFGGKDWAAGDVVLRQNVERPPFAQAHRPFLDELEHLVQLGQPRLRRAPL